MELSKKTQKRIAIACGVVLAGMLVALAVRTAQPTIVDWLKNTQNQPGSAQVANDKNDKADTQPAQSDTANTAPTPQQAQPSTNNYSYTAVAGDSYTLLARTAIQQYAQEHSVTVSAAQAQQAEITLANQAGQPFLEIGQSVEITQQSVADALQVPATAATTSPQASTSNSATSKSKDYNYTAGVGDSYTLLARMAVKAYVASTNLTLTPAQKIAAEATLASQAGQPILEVGQVVAFNATTLAAAIDSARSLNAEQQAGWERWATLAAL